MRTPEEERLQAIKESVESARMKGSGDDGVSLTPGALSNLLSDFDWLIEQVEAERTQPGLVAVKCLYRECEDGLVPKYNAWNEEVGMQPCPQNCDKGRVWVRKEKV